MDITIQFSKILEQMKTIANGINTIKTKIRFVKMENYHVIGSFVIVFDFFFKSPPVQLNL